VLRRIVIGDSPAFRKLLIRRKSASTPPAARGNLQPPDAEPMHQWGQRKDPVRRGIFFAGKMLCL